MSCIWMLQLIYLFSNDNITISNKWSEFIDGFQLFKFDLKFLDFIINIRSNLDKSNINVNERMYYLLLEDRSAMLNFLNFILLFIILCIFKIILWLIKKCKWTMSIEENNNKWIIRWINCLLNISKLTLFYLNFDYKLIPLITYLFYMFTLYLDIKLQVLIDLCFQFLILWTIAGKIII